jgi:hypothetical protein
MTAVRTAAERRGILHQIKKAAIQIADLRV